MKPVAECEIDLFADELPSMDDIWKLSEFVHSSESNTIAFGEQVEANMSKTSAKAVLETGIGLFIIGKNAKAVEVETQVTGGAIGTG